MAYGLLNDPWNDPRAMGILGMSSGLLEASGPSKMPISFGQALGQGIQTGMAGYQSARQGQIRQMIAEQELEQSRRLAEAQAAKLEEERQTRAANAATMAEMGQTPQSPSPLSFGPNVSPEIGNSFSALGDYSGTAFPANQDSPPAAATAPQDVALQYAKQYLDAAVKTRNPAGVKLGQEMYAKAAQASKDLKTTYKTAPQVVTLSDNSLGLMIVGDDGAPKILPYSPAIKGELVNRGGFDQFNNPYNGAAIGEKMGKTMTPGEVDSSSRGWASIAQQGAQNKATNSRADERLAFDKSQAGVDTPTLSGAAIENAADRYNLDGTLPPLGLGKSGAEMRRAVLDKAAEKKQGVSGTDQRISQMGFKADSQSLASMVKASDAIGSFERNLSGAVDLLGPLMDKVNNGKIPAINKLSQIVSYQGGDPNIKAAKNQLITAMMDYQKLVTAGSNVSAAELSVGAQKRAEELLSMADNPETFKNQIAVILQDGNIKADSLKTGISDIRARMGGNAPAQSPGGFVMPTPEAIAAEKARRGL